MSMAVLLNGILATDSQMLNRIRERDEYISFGKKLFISPDNRAAIAVVGSEWDSIELALVWTFVQARLADFYLSYEQGQPLEFSDDERKLLTGASSRDKVFRRFFLITRTHAWSMKFDSDEGGILTVLDPLGYYAHGSECSSANIYYKAGFAAPEIISRICRITNTCGGDVQMVKAADLEEYARTIPEKPAKKPRGTKPASTKTTTTQRRSTLR